jgi:predicted GTPase
MALTCPQFINLVSGSSLRVGTGLHSCTADIQVSHTFELEGRSVMLIDTPGFDDTSKSDTDILRTISSFLVAAYSIFLSLNIETELIRMAQI